MVNPTGGGIQDVMPSLNTSMGILTDMGIAGRISAVREHIYRRGGIGGYGAFSGVKCGGRKAKGVDGGMGLYGDFLRFPAQFSMVSYPLGDVVINSEQLSC